MLYSSASSGRESNETVVMSNHSPREFVPNDVGEAAKQR
jgi:hypothetical protein